MSTNRPMSKIDKGKAWRMEKLAEGWEQTPDGLLPLAEINKAGFVPSGTGWKIPSEEFLSTGEDGSTVGTKYKAATSQYIAWRNNKPPSIEIIQLDELTFQNEDESPPAVDATPLESNLPF